MSQKLILKAWLFGNLTCSSGLLLQQVPKYVDVLSLAVMHNCQAIEYHVIEQGGTCVVINGVCYLFSNNSLFTKGTLQAFMLRLEGFTVCTRMIDQHSVFGR